jgi:hypothetical protein
MRVLSPSFFDKLIFAIISAVIVSGVIGDVLFFSFGGVASYFTIYICLLYIFGVHMEKCGLEV